MWEYATLTVKSSISTHHLAGVSLSEQKEEREYTLRAQREGKQTGGCVDEDMRTYGTQTDRYAWFFSLFRQELQYAVGSGDLAHGLGASLVVASRRRGLVVNVDTGVWPFHWRGARWWTKKTCKAGHREKNRKTQDKCKYN